MTQFRPDILSDCCIIHTAEESVSHLSARVNHSDCRLNVCIKGNKLTYIKVSLNKLSSDVVSCALKIKHNVENH